MLIRDKGPTFIFFRLVCASNFSMAQATHQQKGGVTIYALCNIALEQINSVFEDHMNANVDGE